MLDIPKKPDIEIQEKKDGRKLCVMPLAALVDKRLSAAQKVALGVLCSYANKAGIAYVSQGRIGSDLGVTQARISRALTALRKAGYIETIGRPRPGDRGRTLRIIYDPQIQLQDAIAIAGTADTDKLLDYKDIDEMIKDEKHEWTAEELKANKQRILELLHTAFSTVPTKVYQPVEGDTLTVKRIKEQIRTQQRLNRRKELTEYAVNDKKDTYDDTDMSQKVYKRINNRLYDYSDNVRKSNVEVVQKGMHTQPMTYEDYVYYFQTELFNGVKTENDLRMCALLADARVSRDTLERYVSAYGGETCEQIARRILG